MAALQPAASATELLALQADVEAWAAKLEREYLPMVRRLEAGGYPGAETLAGDIERLLGVGDADIPMSLLRETVGHVIDARGDLGKWAALFFDDGSPDGPEKVARVLQEINAFERDGEEMTRAYLDYLDREKAASA